MTSKPSYEALEQRIKELDQELCHSKQLLMDILNHIPEPIFIKDDVHRQVLVNDAYCKVSGYCRADILGKTDKELYPKDQAETAWENDRQVLEGRDPTSNKEIYTDAKGGRHMFQIDRAPLCRFQGKKGLIGLAHAIDEHPQIESCLCERDQRLSTAVSHSGIIFAQSDLDCRYVWIAYPHVDFDSATVIGKQDIEVVDNAGTRQLMQLKRSVIESGREQRRDIGFQLSDGLRIYDVIAAPLTDEGGRITGVSTCALDITKRRCAEEELRKSEEKYRQLFELAQEGIWVIDADGNTRLVNSSMARMLGYGPDEMQGRHLYSFMDEKNIAIARTKLEQRQRGIREQHDFEFRHKDGYSVFTTVETAPILNNAGEYAGAIAGVINITQRKQVEDALLESEARLNAFLKHAPVGFGILDTQYRYLYVNDVLQKMNGPSRQDHIGHTIEEVLPKAAAMLIPLFDQVICSGQPLLNLELSGEVPSRPGEITHYLVSYFPISVGDGALRYVGGVMVDITEQQLAKAAFKESEARYRSLVEFSSEHIFMLSRDGRYLASNGRIERINPDQMPSLVGRRLNRIYPPETAARYLKMVEQVFTTAEAVEFEHSIQKGDDTRNYLNTLYPIRKAGKVASVGGICRDITALKRLDYQLRQARKMESIGTLAGGIAHDFNNFLFMITGNAELALEDIPEYSPVHATIQEIKTASLRAADVVRQLLKFSQKSDRDLRPIGAISAIKDALKFIRASIPQTIEIQTTLPTAEISVLGDPVQIKQVMVNLCTNAYQAMETIGGTLDIRVDKVRLTETDLANDPDLSPGDFLRITIHDTGPGIDVTIMEHIFDPYFTTREVGKGSGMGLAVVHGIVTDHGGVIKVDSSSGAGTRFTIYFPEICDKTQIGVEPEFGLCKDRATILFVDDEAPIVKMVDRMLSRLGYRVESTTCPLEALDRLRSKPDLFDLVITDMTMPGMTGVLLAERIRDIRSDLPIIICTGHSDLIDVQTAKTMGIDAYIMKPIIKSEIAQIIQDVLNRGTL